MLTVIILGFVLFIVGVGATYVHDHMKASSARREQESIDEELLRKQREQMRARTQQAMQNRRPSTPTPVAKQAGAKRVVKPGATKTTSHKLDDEESMSLQQLIDRIEGMRKAGAKPQGRVTDGSIDDMIDFSLGKNKGDKS